MCAMKEERVKVAARLGLGVSRVTESGIVKGVVCFTFCCVCTSNVKRLRWKVRSDFGGEEMERLVVDRVFVREERREGGDSGSKMDVKVFFSVLEVEVVLPSKSRARSAGEKISMNLR